MSTAIETKNVTGRRQLHFNSVDEIMADVEQLAITKEVRSLGNWSPGQILNHLTIVMENSVHGAPSLLPGFTRFMIRLLFKSRFLKKPMRAGFKLPKSAAYLLPGPITFEDALGGFRQAVQSLQTNAERKPHPALGTLTNAEWEQLHCRHSELHLSFIVPV